MKKISIYLFLLALLAGPSCSKSQKPTEGLQSTKPQAPQSPLSFPSKKPQVKKGDYVFAPPEKMVRDAKKGKAFFAFYLREVHQVGDQESELATQERIEKIPNALLIPLGSNPGAKIGDIVLVPHPLDHQSMTRGLVAELEEDGEARVHLLEPRPLARLDNRKFNVAPGTYRALTQSGEPGSQLMCKGEKGFSPRILIHATSSQYLTMSPIGSLKIYSKSDCESLPLKPQLSIGDKVFVPIGKYYREGKVKKIEERLARVYVEYPFGKLIKERTFPYGVIATTAPGTSSFQ